MADKKRRWSKVSRRTWNDEKFRRLTAPPPNGQTLWFRLLTGPELTNVPGLIPIGEAGLAEAMGWDLEGFREAFAEVQREGLAEADWKARLVWVPKAIYHNEPESPNVVKSWFTAWDEAPECELKEKAFRELESFCKAKGKGFLEAFRKACSKPSPKASANQEQEQEQKKYSRAHAREGFSPNLDGAPKDPLADHMNGRGPGHREDVQQVYEAWKLAVDRPNAKLRGGRDLDAVTIAEAIDAHGLEDCLRVAKYAPNDGMVTGKLDEKGREHKSVKYIFGNTDAFQRILHAARDRDRKTSRKRSAREVREELAKL